MHHPNGNSGITVVQNLKGEIGESKQTLAEMVGEWEWSSEMTT